MLPYWLLFAVWAISAVQAERRRTKEPRLIFFVASTIFTIMLIGLRFEVGGDWGAYQRMYDAIYFLPLASALPMTDPGYAAVNWTAAQMGLGITFVNSVCAILFMSGFARLAWRQPNPGIAILVALPYLIIVVAMGYTRQAAAIGIICFAIADASERHLFRLAILIGIAALFHKTAILVLPIALVPVFRRNAVLGVLGGLMFVALFTLLLRDSSDRLVTSYVQGSYDSQGASIRTAMNLLPAGLFLLLRRHIVMPAFQKSFWVTCALLSIVSVAALASASASAGIDRLSLYLIPLQSVLYSRLPHLLGNSRKALPSILIGIIGYSFMVEFVWLNYADNSYYWVPYTMALHST